MRHSLFFFIFPHPDYKMMMKWKDTIQHHLWCKENLQKKDLRLLLQAR